MTKCQSGRLLERQKYGELSYFVRLNLISIDSNGNKKYSVKDFYTGLTANKRNKTKAYIILEEKIASYSEESDKILFSNYMKEWVEHKKPSVRQRTYDSYTTRSKAIIDYFQKRKFRLGEIKPKDVSDFYNHLLTKELPDGKKYSNTTIKDIAKVFKMALNDAVIWEYIPKSPAENIRVPGRFEVKEPKPVISKDNLDVFFNAIHGHPLELAFIICLYFGLRREEVLGLKWSAIRDGQLYIEHTCVETSVGIVREDKTKTIESYRSYPLSDEMMKKFDTIKFRQEENRRIFGNEYIESDYIFTWENGKLYQPSYLSKSFKKVILNTPKLDNKLTMHSMRRSCITMLIRDGVNVKDVAAWVGHRDVQTTLNVYAQTSKEQQRKIANDMDGLMFPAS